VTPRSFPLRPHFPQMSVTRLAIRFRPSERTQKPRILRIDAGCNFTNAREPLVCTCIAARVGNAGHGVLIGCARLVTFRYGASDYTDCVQKLNRLGPAGNPRALFLPKEDFIMAHQELREALTFDDVLLLPQSSDLLPANCDVSTALTPKIR